MKDGVNSANRYYLNRFRDAYRQAVIGKETNKTNNSTFVYHHASVSLLLVFEKLF